MTKIFEPTDDQWWQMCNAHMSRPIHLAEADLSKPFVYSREHGVMYTPMGYHIAAMATLHAFTLGKAEYLDLGDIYAQLPEDAADAFVEFVPGAAFRSSVGSQAVQVWNTARLTPAERRAFGTARSIDPLAQT